MVLLSIWVTFKKKYLPFTVHHFSQFCYYYQCLFFSINLIQLLTWKTLVWNPPPWRLNRYPGWNYWLVGRWKIFFSVIIWLFIIGLFWIREMSSKTHRHQILKESSNWILSFIHLPLGHSLTISYVFINSSFLELSKYYFQEQAFKCCLLLKLKEKNDSK